MPRKPKIVKDSENFMVWLIEMTAVILTPACWFQYSGTRYSKQWDSLLRSFLRVGKFVRRSRYHAEICEFDVWVGNHPYASFTIPDPVGSPDRWGAIEEVRPSRRTILLAGKKLQRDDPE